MIYYIIQIEQLQLPRVSRLTGNANVGLFSRWGAHTHAGPNVGGNC